MTKYLRLLNPVYGLELSSRTGSFLSLIGSVTLVFLLIDVSVIFVKFEAVNASELRLLIIFYLLSLVANFYYRKEILEE